VFSEGIGESGFKVLQDLLSPGFESAGQFFKWIEATHGELCCEALQGLADTPEALGSIDLMEPLFGSVESIEFGMMDKQAVDFASFKVVEPVSVAEKKPSSLGIVPIPLNPTPLFDDC
jgi:hypothetical protein